MSLISSKRFQIIGIILRHILNFHKSQSKVRPTETNSWVSNIAMLITNSIWYQINSNQQSLEHLKWQVAQFLANFGANLPPFKNISYQGPFAGAIPVQIQVVVDDDVQLEDIRMQPLQTRKSWMLMSINWFKPLNSKAGRTSFQSAAVKTKVDVHNCTCRQVILKNDNRNVLLNSILRGSIF